jgi:NADPH2:quinone reductase
LTDLDVKVRKIPENVSYETAAALAIQGLTAITLIEKAYVVQKGDYILVHAVAGGVGSLLAQLIHDKGAIVIGTTSSKDKAEFGKKNGADYVINYKEENILERVLEITKGEGVHAVLDSVGGPGFSDSIKAVRPNGIVVSYGGAAGFPSPVSISFFTLYNNYLLSFLFFRSKSQVFSQRMPILLEVLFSITLLLLLRLKDGGTVSLS